MSSEPSSLSECIQFLRFVVAGIQETDVCDEQSAFVHFLCFMAYPYLMRCRMLQPVVIESEAFEDVIHAILHSLMPWIRSGKLEVAKTLVQRIASWDGDKDPEIEALILQLKMGAEDLEKACYRLWTRHVGLRELFPEYSDSELETATLSARHMHSNTEAFTKRQAVLHLGSANQPHQHAIQFSVGSSGSASTETNHHPRAVPGPGRINVATYVQSDLLRTVGSAIRNYYQSTEQSWPVELCIVEAADLTATEGIPCWPSSRWNVTSVAAGTAEIYEDGIVAIQLARDRERSTPIFITNKDGAVTFAIFRRYQGLAMSRVTGVYMNQDRCTECILQGAERCIYVAQLYRDGRVWPTHRRSAVMVYDSNHCLRCWHVKNLCTYSKCTEELTGRSVEQVDDPGPINPNSSAEDEDDTENAVLDATDLNFQEEKQDTTQLSPTSTHTTASNNSITSQMESHNVLADDVSKEAETRTLLAAHLESMKAERRVYIQKLQHLQVHVSEIEAQLLSHLSGLRRELSELADNETQDL